MTRGKTGECNLRRRISLVSPTFLRALHFGCASVADPPLPAARIEVVLALAPVTAMIPVANDNHPTTCSSSTYSKQRVVASATRGAAGAPRGSGIAVAEVPEWFWNPLTDGKQNSTAEVR